MLTSERLIVMQAAPVAVRAGSYTVTSVADAGTMNQNTPRSFWRIIAGPVLQHDDFLSDEETGGPEPTRPDHRRWWTGRSVFNTETQARKKATAYPSLGRYLSRIDVTPGSKITCIPNHLDGHLGR